MRAVSPVALLPVTKLFGSFDPSQSARNQRRSRYASRRFFGVFAYATCLSCRNLPALQAAIDAGADAVYAGFRDQTNARAFPGLNFSDDELRSGIAYAQARGRKVYLALNTYPDSAQLAQWFAAVDRAAEFGCDHSRQGT